MSTRTENMQISDNGNAWRGGSRPTFGRGASRGTSRGPSGPIIGGGGAGPSFLRNRFAPISRERTGSIKRLRSDSDEGGRRGDRRGVGIVGASTLRKPWKKSIWNWKKLKMKET